MPTRLHRLERISPLHRHGRPHQQPYGHFANTCVRGRPLGPAWYMSRPRNDQGAFNCHRLDRPHGHMAASWNRPRLSFVWMLWCSMRACAPGFGSMEPPSARDTTPQKSQTTWRLRGISPAFSGPYARQNMFHLFTQRQKQINHTKIKLYNNNKQRQGRLHAHT